VSVPGGSHWNDDVSTLVGQDRDERGYQTMAKKAKGGKKKAGKKR
jgi:hypothetical protein